MANMKTRELLANISKNIGVEDLDFLNAIPEEAEVPETFNDLFHANYLTLSAAKNNQDLSNFYRGKYLGTVDSKLKAVFKANAMDDLYNPLEDEKDTLTRIEKAFEVFKTTKNKGGNDDEKWAEKKKQFETEISRLQNEIQSKNDLMQQSLNDNNSVWEKKFFGFAINDKLAKKQFSDTYDTDDVRFLIQQKINSLPYIYKRNENDGFDVYDKNAPEIIVHKEGKPLTFEALIDEVSEKYTKKSEPTQPIIPNRVVVEPKTTTVPPTVMGSPNYGI